MKLRQDCKTPCRLLLAALCRLLSTTLCKSIEIGTAFIFSVTSLGNRLARFMHQNEIKKFKKRTDTFLTMIFLLSSEFLSISSNFFLIKKNCMTFFLVICEKFHADASKSLKFCFSIVNDHRYRVYNFHEILWSYFCSFEQSHTVDIYYL